MGAEAIKKGRLKKGIASWETRFVELVRRYCNVPRKYAANQPLAVG